MKLISGNKKAHFDFFIEDKFEAGIELQGWEVKSARAGNVNLKDSFVIIRKGECFLKNAHISNYEYGDVKNQDVRRDRRLLLHKAQINKIESAVKTKGYTCVATRMYLDKGLVKVEIALAKGKLLHDKRQTLKERDIKREVEKEIKNK